MADEGNLRYFERKAAESRFNRDSLEKVYRLVRLLQGMKDAPEFDGRFVLKGGTALHLAVFGLMRLSVDLDLNYIGSLEKDAVERDRMALRDALMRLFVSQGYKTESPSISHVSEGFRLGYYSAFGNRDYIKVDLNYIERLPAKAPTMMALRHPFEVLGDASFPTLAPEELFAGKMRALLGRGTPRDMFDAHLIFNAAPSYDEALFRKLVVFYLCLSNMDARKVSADSIMSADNGDIRGMLIPMMPRGISLDISRMRDDVSKSMRRLLDFSDDEKRFLAEFYVFKRYNHAALFGDLSVADLSSHPMLQWRLAHLR